MTSTGSGAVSPRGQAASEPGCGGLGTAQGPGQGLVHLALARLWRCVLPSTGWCVEADNLGVKASGASHWKEQAEATCCYHGDLGCSLEELPRQTQM